MSVGRPEANDPEFAHDGQAARIGQSESLAGELLDGASRLRKFRRVEAPDGQAGERIDEGWELRRTVPYPCVPSIF
jgi:hypothetical protein